MAEMQVWGASCRFCVPGLWLGMRKAVPPEPGPVLAALPHAVGGFDVEVPVQLVDQHQVQVHLLAVQLQPQVTQPLDLQEGTFQGIHC